ncbi:MAG: LamG domain-containing protein, partial [Phycisphaerae bacterium]|nr:LamG domain-containing protein [Phycisphaerae bacterium]
APVQGGSGAIYVDDIRACPPRCIPSLAKPLYDIAQPYDCIVDEKDIRMVLGDWLVEATDPGTGNLVGWWKLDDATGATAQDSSIYGNHGTLISMDPTSDWVTGRIGGALHFDGIDDYVDCGNGASLQITGTAISLAAWVKYDTGEDYSGIAMKTSSGDWSDGYGLYADNDAVNFYVVDYGNIATKSFTADDQWHHVAGTYDGSNVRVWVDGVEGTPLGYTGSISNADHSFEIGRGGDNSYNFSGALDDVRLYNVALTDTDILGLSGLRTDLYEDKKINFKDYALIADKYLEEILWPTP